MRNDPLFNISFVELVEKYPQLYNYTLDGYSNREEVDRAWKEISKALNEPVADCIDKWRNIRGGFTRSLKAKVPSAAGLKPKPKKMYYLSKYLQFIRPYIKSRTQKRSFEQASTSSKQIDELSDESNNENLMYIKNEFDDAVHEPSNLTSPSPSADISDFRRRHKRRKDTKSIEQSFIEFVELKKQKLRHIDSPELLFFHSLSPDIARLSESNKMKFKIGSLNLLNDLLNTQT